MSHPAFWGQRVRELRVASGMSQEELAKKSGYTSRSSINKIELGLVDPPLTKLLTISGVFGLTPLQFLFPRFEDLTDEDLEVIKAYKENPQLQPYIKMLLGVSSNTEQHMYTAAHSIDNVPDGFVTIPADVAERLAKAPETDDPLL